MPIDDARQVRIGGAAQGWVARSDSGVLSVRRMLAVASAAACVGEPAGVIAVSGATLPGTGGRYHTGIIRPVNDQ